MEKMAGLAAEPYLRMQKIPRHIFSNLGQQNILITDLNNLKIFTLMVHELSTAI